MWDGKIGRHNWISQLESKTLLLLRLIWATTSYRVIVQFARHRQNKTGFIARFRQYLHSRIKNVYSDEMLSSFQWHKVIKLNGNIKCLVRAKCILIRGHQVSRKCYLWRLKWQQCQMSIAAWKIFQFPVN